MIVEESGIDFAHAVCYVEIDLGGIGSGEGRRSNNRIQYSFLSNDRSLTKSEICP